MNVWLNVSYLFSGSSANFEQGTRGDLILFYNKVYVQNMKAYAMRFRTAQEVRGSFAFIRH